MSIDNGQMYKSYEEMFFSLIYACRHQKEAVAAFLQHSVMQPEQLSKEAFTEWDGFLNSPLFFA